MSRSRKKTPITGFTRAISDHPWKTKASRAFRHRAEQRLRVTLEGDALPVKRWERVDPWSSPKDGKHWVGTEKLQLLRK